MMIIGYLLKGLGMIISPVITIFIFILIARIIASWMSADPENAIVRFVTNSTEPLLAPIRRKIPPLGILDLSALVLMLVLYFLQSVLVARMVEFGVRLTQGE